VRFTMRSRLAMGRFHTAVLLVVIPIAMLIPCSDVVLSQTSPGTVAEPPLFTAIDLNPDGFVESWASGVSIGQQVGNGYGPVTGGYGHALLWRGTAASVVDLHPAGFIISRALGISGGQQVGVGISSQPAGGSHALLWRGTAASVVDLHPSGFVSSEASGISDGQEVGWGYGPATGERRHALLWRSTAASVVDLHPSGFTASEALGTSDGQEVGWGSTSNCVVGQMSNQGCYNHALLWLSTAGSAVDLGNGEAYGTSGEKQVGHGGPHGNAVVWTGSASGAVDLQPSGFYGSTASGASGAEQVGYGGPWTQTHALLWRGNARNLVDLHAFLPPGFEGSMATGIDSNGDVVGVAWGPVTDNRSHAFLWTQNANAKPTPGPPIDKFMAVGNSNLTLRTLSVAAGDEVEVIVMDPLGHQFHLQKIMAWELGIPNQMAGQYTLDVIGRASGSFTVEVNASDASGHYITHYFEGTAVPGRISRFTFPGEVNAFAAFGAHVKINPTSKSFAVTGTFTLGPGGMISPATQPVTLELHGIWTIPVGSFRQTGQGTFVFEGTIDAEGVALRANLAQIGDKSYSFMIEGAGAADLPDANPVEVRFTIGNNTGSSKVDADFAP